MVGTILTFCLLLSPGGAPNSVFAGLQHQLGTDSKHRLVLAERFAHAVQMPFDVESCSVETGPDGQFVRSRFLSGPTSVEFVEFGARIIQIVARKNDVDRSPQGMDGIIPVAKPTSKHRRFVRDSLIRLGMVHFRSDHPAPFDSRNPRALMTSALQPNTMSKRLFEVVNGTLAAPYGNSIEFVDPRQNGRYVEITYYGNNTYRSKVIKVNPLEACQIARKLQPDGYHVQPGELGSYRATFAPMDQPHAGLVEREIRPRILRFAYVFTFATGARPIAVNAETSRVNIL